MRYVTIHRVPVERKSTALRGRSGSPHVSVPHVPLRSAPRRRSSPDAECDGVSLDAGPRCLALPPGADFGHPKPPFFSKSSADSAPIRGFGKAPAVHSRFSGRTRQNLCGSALFSLGLIFLGLPLGRAYFSWLGFMLRFVSILALGALLSAYATMSTTHAEWRRLDGTPANSVDMQKPFLECRGQLRLLRPVRLSRCTQTSIFSPLRRTNATRRYLRLCKGA